MKALSVFMFKRLSLIISLSCIVYCSNAQFDTAFIMKNIRHCADSLTYGFKTKDWELFTRYSYPALIGSLGGKKEFTTYISQMFSQVPDTAWKKYETGKIVQVVKKGSDFQAILELNTILEWQGSRITTTSHLIGDSWNGMFWTFFDSQGEPAAARLIKPDLDPLLIIPNRIEKREPISKPPQPKG